MLNRHLKQIIGAAVLLINASVFIITVQPSVSFWDPGEISSASFSLMVPHPPGAPLWLILGRIFSMLPLAENIGLRINMLSVTASCISVLLLYLTAIKLMENYRKHKEASVSDSLITYISAAAGALAFAFCDTFWFNAVEANYFAVSTLLFSLVVWIMMIWNEQPHRPGNERYIILMAYIIGLSAGVHLMSVLAVLTFVWIVAMRKYVTDEETYRKSALLFLLHLGVLAVFALALWASQTGTAPPSEEQYRDFDSRFKLIMAGISILFISIFRKQIFVKSSFYIPLLAGGIILPIAYPGVVKIFPVLLLKAGGPSPAVNLFIFFLLLAALIYLSLWAKKKSKPLLNLSALSLAFALIGFTTYAMIIIRSNQQTPMNENEPKDFTKLVYYLGREQYGDFPAFQRRFSREPHQQGIYTNYSSDLDFLWNYQIDHMYNRYLFWNFVGRESTEQDAGINFNELFAIPLLMGLLGLCFHFRKDWKMASAFLVLFIFMGYLITFYQNQQQPQPRERDYFYAGALFVFCLWIAAGLNELTRLVKENINKQLLARSAAFGVLFLGVALIPARMLAVNFHTHDRSKDWLPWDLSYNLLQSCAPDAILFTNGDNDTFPLWYLQYVEGIRRDVRIVCLSLANTSWYVSQLKHTRPYGCPEVKFSLSDQEIENLEPIAWKAKEISIPVNKDAVRKTGISDSSVVRAGRLTFTMHPTLGTGDATGIMIQDIVVRDIVLNNSWARPIYFSATIPFYSRIGLDEYLRLEGLALRLVPQRKPANSDFINEPLLHRQLFEENPSFSADYRPGFKFRGLNDRSIFFEKDTHQQMAQSYRSTFIQLAVHYLNVTHNREMAVKTLDEMERKIPRDHIEIDFRHLTNVANIYFLAGAADRYAQLAKEIESAAWQNMSSDPDELQSPYNSYRVLEDLYINLKQYDKAIDVLKRLQTVVPDDPGIQTEIDRISRMKGVSL